MLEVTTYRSCEARSSGSCASIRGRPTSPTGRAILHDKIISNIQEVRARGARIIAIAEEGDEKISDYADYVIRVPVVPPLMQPLVSTVPLQVFACEMATAKGHDVDQPRNLAKSVTVE